MRESALGGLLVLFTLGCGHDGPPDHHEPGPEEQPPRLAAELGIELATVASFVVQAAPASGTRDRQWRASGQQLFALTLAGELIELSLIEEPSEGFSGSYQQPIIQHLHSTSTWIVFATPNFVAYELHEDMDVEIPCSMIAARRSDGALFCADLGVRGTGDNYGNLEPGSQTVLGSATGDLLYVVSADSVGENVVYRVETLGDDGLSGTLLESIWRTNWLAVNATGDLLGNYRPAGLEPPDSVTEIHLASGGPSLEVPTNSSEFIHHRFGIAGKRGAADQDNFYVLEVEQDVPDRLQILSKQADGFAITEHAVDLPGNCVFLHPLADGIYTVCGTSLARVVEAGEVLTTPTMIPLAGVEQLVPVGGQPMRFAEQMVVLTVSDGTTQAFVRHDGLTQQTIPFGDQVELLGISVAGLGDINFMGVTIDTHAQVIGTVAAGTDQVEILDYEAIDAASVIAFTRIN
jgi:hypothetical protein